MKNRLAFGGTRRKITSVEEASNRRVEVKMKFQFNHFSKDLVTPMAKLQVAQLIYNNRLYNIPLSSFDTTKNLR